MRLLGSDSETDEAVVSSRQGSSGGSSFAMRPKSASAGRKDSSSHKRKSACLFTLAPRKNQLYRARWPCGWV